MGYSHKIFRHLHRHLLYLHFLPHVILSIVMVNPSLSVYYSRSDACCLNGSATDLQDRGHVFESDMSANNTGSLQNSSKY